MTIKVSFIIPTHNAAKFIVETLESIQNQQVEPNIELEISIHDDGSTDETFQLCEAFLKTKWLRGSFALTKSENSQGAGRARNLAVAQSTGRFLCFQDADDVSFPRRVQTQLNICLEEDSDEILVGTKFIRDPPDATHHYASFLNKLSQDDLYLKSFRELTLIQPTWFLPRVFFERLGGYHEGILAEDLELFERILDIPNVRLRTSVEPLVVYRHLSGSSSSRTSRLELVHIRVKAFERRVLSQESWNQFSIWGAGRDGRAFFESLSHENRVKVQAFYDVDEKKIKASFHFKGLVLPIHYFRDIHPPFVVCVALGRTNGELERNVTSFGLIEGKDYWYFN